jgi:hypothetical protein
MVRALLVVTVLLVGGPPRNHHPSPAIGMWIALPHHIARTDRQGAVRLRLRPGVYRIRVVSKFACTHTEVRLSRPGQRVVLYCSVP